MFRNGYELFDCSLTDFMKHAVGIEETVSSMNQTIDVPNLRSERSIDTFVVEKVGPIFVQLVHVAYSSGH